MPLLSDNVKIDIRRFRHELLNRQIVRIPAQSTDGGSPNNRLRYSILSYKRCSRMGRIPSREWNDMRSEISRKLQAGFQRTLALYYFIPITYNVDYIELCAQGLSQPRTAGD